MAGNSRSGRRRNPGKTFRLTIRYRPDRHSPELRELLERLAAAGPVERAVLLDQVTRKGFEPGEMGAEEIIETAEMLEDLFS